MRELQQPVHSEHIRHSRLVQVDQMHLQELFDSKKRRIFLDVQQVLEEGQANVDGRDEGQPPLDHKEAVGRREG